MGWHLWGSDLCIQSKNELDKYQTRIIDVPLFHNSTNDFIFPEDFHKSLYQKKQIIKDKFDLKLEMLDPVGHVVEKWALSNCEFKSIDFGELSYQIDDPVVCSLVIKLGDVVLEY
jgi:hypothetical protein